MHKVAELDELFHFTLAPVTHVIMNEKFMICWEK